MSRKINLDDIYQQISVSKERDFNQKCVLSDDGKTAVCVAKKLNNGIVYKGYEVLRDVGGNRWKIIDDGGDLHVRQELDNVIKRKFPV